MANALMTALAKAQLEFAPIVKNRTNYNKGTYADLTAILEAVKPALLKHGVVILQSPVTRYLENNLFVVDIVTTICHGESGETFEGILSMPAKNDAQAIGSAITYGRRYALVSMLSLSTEDDNDGEESIKSAQKATQPQRQTQQPPAHRQPAPPPPANGNGHKPPTEAAAEDDDAVAGWAANPKDVLFNGYTFKNPAEAKGWAMAMGVFDDDKHADNAYDKVKKEQTPKTAQDMWDAWINEVAKRANEKETVTA